MVVVQLDVKKAFDHVQHRAAFKAMRLQRCSLFSMALTIAGIWSGSCMKARQVSADESWTASRRNGVSGHRHNDHGAFAERSGQELESSKASVESGRLRAGGELPRRRCGQQRDRNIESSGTDNWVQRTQRASHPKMVDSSIMVDGSAVLWEEILAFVVSKVYLDGPARHARVRTEQLKRTNALRKSELC